MYRVGGVVSGPPAAPAGAKPRLRPAASTAATAENAFARHFMIRLPPLIAVVGRPLVPVRHEQKQGEISLYVVEIGPSTYVGRPGSADPEGLATTQEIGQKPRSHKRLRG